MTYFKSDDALRAIQAVNNIVADGRTLKASLGTTKYCSHFMKNMTCPKHDCMYLHELGKFRNTQLHDASFNALRHKLFMSITFQVMRLRALQKKKCNKGNTQNTRRICMTN